MAKAAKASTKPKDGKDGKALKGKAGRGAQHSPSPAPGEKVPQVEALASAEVEAPQGALIAGVIAMLVAGVVLAGLGGSTPAGGGSDELAGGEQLATLVASVRGTSWGEGTPLAKKLQHSLARAAKGSAVAEGARSFVVGGERSTAADRTELVGLLDKWVGVHSRCEVERGWRLDVDGRSLDTQGAEALYEQLATAACAATLVVLSSAEQVDIDVMQQFEPLLSGEGPALATEVFLVLDVEAPGPDQDGDSSSGGDAASTCAGKRGAKRYNCLEQKLQDWIRSSVWKRRGLLGRITQWIPFG